MEHEQKDPNAKPKRNIVMASQRTAKRKVNASLDEPSIRLAYQVAGGGVSSSLVQGKK
jgi:hypothetical protein